MAKQATAKASKTAERKSAAYDDVTMRILGFTGKRKKTVPGAMEGRGVRREARKQLQGYIPEVAHDLIDRIAEDFEVTKQDLFAIAVNSIMERFDARWSPINEKQKNAAAKNAADNYRSVNPNASEEEIEAVREAAIDELRLRQEELDGEPFRLPIERDIRDPEVAKSSKTRSMGMVSRQYGTINFDKARERARQRLEAHRLYEEKGLADLGREERMSKIEELSDEHPELAWLFGTWLKKLAKGQSVAQVAESRKDRRPFCAWFPLNVAHEAIKLAMENLGGGQTSMNAVAIAGARAIILDNRDILEHMDLTEQEREALKILEDGDMDDVYHAMKAYNMPGEDEEAEEEKPKKGRGKKAS